MTTFFTILMIITMVLVVLSLAVGLVTMAKGGEFNQKFGNKMMRLRVTLQGLALLFFVLAIWSSNS